MTAKFTELNTNHLSTILNSISDGVFTVDNEWRITSFNRAAEDITGISREEAVGKLCCEVFRASICESSCSLRHTLETGTPIVNQSIYIVDAEGNKIPISISTAILKDHQDDIIGGVETFRDLSQVEELQKELKQTFQLGDIISKNHKIQEIFSILPDIAMSGSNVLITGESGTGKELFARAIHDLSNRKDKPFIAVNCGALQDSLLESELFGYKAGAFTDAKHDKPGRFALAEGGTLFLDEIGDISPALQVRLLRVLQEKMYDPLGSTHSVKADARIITATNKDLSALVEQGTFREDLYYRVNVMKIDLPPLRERKEDIPFLVDHFINRFNRIFNKEISTLAPDTLGILVGYDYPGNIRELENIMEHAFVLCSGTKIEPRHLPGFLHPASASHSNSQPTQKAATMHEVEKQLILDTLQRNNWNRKSTADELGIHKSTLFRKIQKLGIELPQFDGRYTRK